MASYDEYTTAPSLHLQINEYKVCLECPNIYVLFENIKPTYNHDLSFEHCESWMDYKIFPDFTLTIIKFYSEVASNFQIKTESCWF